MENRKPKQVTDVIDYIKYNFWNLTIREEDILDSVLILFSAQKIKELNKVEHLVNNETERLLKLLNDREVIDYVTENWKFIAHDDEDGLEEALDDLDFNWIEKVTDTDMINSLKNDGWSVEYDYNYPKHQNDIVTQSDLEEMTELFLKADFSKRQEIINTLK